MGKLRIVLGIIVAVVLGSCQVLLKDAEVETAPPPSRAPAAKPAVLVQPKPRPPRDAVWALCQKARQLAKSDADAALGTLQSALGQYPQHKADVYFRMAMCVEEKIRKAGAGAPRGLFQQKLDYLLKAKEAIDAGGKWMLDPYGAKTGNLGMSIMQAEKEASR